MAAGQHQWAAISVDFGIRQSVRPPKVGLTQGGKEPSWDAPSAIDPALGKAFRALEARHPDFDVDTFHARVRVMFATLQDAWSSQQWDRARPYVTDTLFQTLRFWIEQYEEHGLVNRLDDIELDKIAFIRIQRDAWYEAITVRIWGRMKDYVVDKQGDVVGGNKNRQRLFSEYWTLLRSIGTGAACGDPLQCPSCGAALDQISQTGVCGYCETKITSGQFDWVLTRIDHAELGPS